MKPSSSSAYSSYPSYPSCVAYLLLAAGFASASFAQPAPSTPPAPTPPAAKVLGPQSPQEQYPAPVAQPQSLEGMIDFPALIAAPGADDGVQITASLRKLRLEFMGQTEPVTPADFIELLGHSRVEERRRAALYAALTAKLARFRELPLTLGDTRFMQQDITEVYRASGYPLMAVVVPPQQIIEGALRVQINEFNLAAFTLMYGDGQGGYSADAKHWTSDRRLKAFLSPLLAEPVLRQRSLDRKVKYLNSNPYRTARVVFEPGALPGQSTAVFQLDEKRTWGVQAGYNNHATKASGTNRYSLGGSVGNLPFESQQLSWNATVGDRIDEFEDYSLVYTVPTTLGHKITSRINYSDTASSSAPPVGSASTTLQSSVAYDLTVIKGDRFGWDFGATASWKQFERDSLFGGISVGGANFDSTQLALNHTFNFKEATATNQVVVSTFLGFAGITPRNSTEDFRRFYNTPTGSPGTQHFVLNYARVQQLKPLAAALDGWSTETQLSWQLTADQLAGSDNFALGGPSVLRAYPSSEVSGDEGIYAIQFLHAKPLAGPALGFAGRIVEQVQFSAVVEAGEGQFQSGAHESLWDYGVQTSVSFKKGFSVTGSLAFAGKATRLTDQGEAQFYVSTQFRY
jgi:hemolysin activation/secretion protein